MMNIKVGDKVKVINNSDRDYGSVGEISELNYSGYKYIVKYPGKGNYYLRGFQEGQIKLIKDRIGFRYSKGVVFSL